MVTTLLITSQMTTLLEIHYLLIWILNIDMNIVYLLKCINQVTIWLLLKFQYERKIKIVKCFPQTRSIDQPHFFFSDTICNGCFSGINWGQIRYQVSALTQKPKSTFLPCLLKKLDFKPLHFIYGIITFWLWRTGRQRYNTHKHTQVQCASPSQLAHFLKYS